MATVTYNGAALTLGTSIADVYQAPNSSGNVALVMDLRLSNSDGTNAATVQLVKTNSSNTILSYLVGKDINVPAQTTLVVVQGGFLVLKQGEKIRALASAASRVDCNVSVREEA